MGCIRILVCYHKLVKHRGWEEMASARKKKPKSPLTGIWGWVTKRGAAGGEESRAKKISLDSGKKVSIIPLSGICSLKTK